MHDQQSLTIEEKRAYQSLARAAKRVQELAAKNKAGKSRTASVDKANHSDSREVAHAS